MHHWLSDVKSIIGDPPAALAVSIGNSTAKSSVSDYSNYSAFEEFGGAIFN
jgi:hypothetical protein